MIGAAIGSAVGGIMGASAADDANDQAAENAAFARESRAQAVEVIEANQGNVDALQEFLTGMGEQGMENAQSLLDDWETSFGGIQDNLSDYYNNLDPTKFAMQSKVAFQANMNKQMSQFNETMAASGLQSSGMKAQAAKEAAFKTAEAGAQIDINAPEQVAQMQQGFLEFGEPQRAGAQGAYENALANEASYGQVGYGAQTDQATRASNAYLGEASGAERDAAIARESAAGYSSAAGTALGSAMNLGIKAFGGDDTNNLSLPTSDNGWMY